MEKNKKKTRCFVNESSPLQPGWPFIQTRQTQKDLFANERTILFKNVLVAMSSRFLFQKLLPDNSPVRIMDTNGVKCTSLSKLTVISSAVYNTVYHFHICGFSLAMASIMQRLQQCCSKVKGKIACCVPPMSVNIFCCANVSLAPDSRTKCTECMTAVHF